jgi:hypothetical protein
MYQKHEKKQETVFNSRLYRISHESGILSIQLQMHEYVTILVTVAQGELSGAPTASEDSAAYTLW